MKRRTVRAMVRRAFTLLEVLMVIVILGLIATVVITSIGGTEERARRDLAQQQINGVLVPKIDLFRLHCGRYPDEDEGLKALLDQPDDEELEDKWAGPYVKPEQLQDPWGNDFAYQYPGEFNENGFDVSSPGPDGQEGNDDDIGNWQKTD
ncbi:MAG TPA: type II secretion system major pseudopilin GspG [Phycisphaerae bacterium]|nr:type II secretion system major pseudopilin GspG [Phycisphaerae bacterium]